MLQHDTEQTLTTMQAVITSLEANPLTESIARRLHGMAAAVRAALEVREQQGGTIITELVARELDRLIDESTGELSQLLRAAQTRIAETTDSGPPAAPAEPPPAEKPVPSGNQFPAVDEDQKGNNSTLVPEENQSEPFTLNPATDAAPIASSLSHNDDPDPSPAEAPVVSRLPPEVFISLQEQLVRLNQLHGALGETLERFRQKPSRSIEVEQADGVTLRLSETNIELWRNLVEALLNFGSSWVSTGLIAYQDAWNHTVTVYRALLARYARLYPVRQALPAVGANGTA